MSNLPTPHMKKFLTFACLLAFAFAQAQYFGISLGKRRDTIVAGSSKEYPISITPLNGFSSSIFFTSMASSCLQGTVSFSKTTLNAPYQGQNCTITLGQNCPSGWYSITMEGYNGPASAVDTLDLWVTPSASTTWQLYDQTNSVFDVNAYPTLLYFDSTGVLHYSIGSHSIGLGVGYFNHETWYAREKDSIMAVNICGEKISTSNVQDDFVISSDNTHNQSRIIGFYEKHLFIFVPTGIGELDSSYHLVKTYDTTNCPIPIENALLDNKGNLWIISANAMAKQTAGGWWVIDKSNVFTMIYPNSIVQDIKGNYWIGGTDKGLLKYDGTFWTSYTTNTSDLSDNSIIGLQELDGVLYGCTGNSIFSIQNEAVDNIEMPQNFPQGSFISFLAYAATEFYMGVSFEDRGYLARYKDSYWSMFTSDNSDFPYCAGDGLALPVGNILDIKKDNVGDVWLAAESCGLIRFHPDNVIVTSLEQPANTADLSFSILPNPVLDGTFRVVSQTPIELLEVYDVQGHKIASTIEASLSGLTKGVFVVKIYTDGQVHAQKILVL